MSQINLSKTQIQAIEEIKSPLCVKAGPGTGKTMLLVEKIAYLIEKKNILPTQILSLTFTQKAAKELSQRVENRINKAFVSYTFHSFALSIMQTISKEPEQIRVLKDVDSIHFIMQKIEGYGYHDTLKKSSIYLAREVLKTINSLKDQGYTTKTISQVNFKSDYSKQMIITLLIDYEKFKTKKKVVDFHDLEIRLYALLTKKETLARKISILYPFIIVDEFQDTSPLQYRILEILAKKQSHITIVGDEKQSIYGFRGTHQDSFKLFSNNFEDTKTLYLRENFRSSKKIVEATNLFIESMKVEKEQILLPQKEEIGELIEVECKDEIEQYNHILSQIEKEDYVSNKTIAVLARTHSQLKEFVTYASTYGITIQYGLEDIFNNPAIEKILFYLQIVANPKSSMKQITAILEMLPINQLTTQYILHLSRMHESDIISLFRKFEKNPQLDLFKEIKEEYVQDIEIIQSTIKFMIKIIDEFIAHRRIKKTILDIMQQEEMYENALNINDSKLISNYNSMLQFVQEYERLHQQFTLNDFLVYLDTAKQLHHNIVDPEDPNIAISNHFVAMTIHQAKGKEFDEVYILQCTEKSYPLPFREELLQHEHSITKDIAMQEELRLFFVALTRAKDKAYLLTPQFNSKGMAYKRSQYLNILNNSQEIIESKEHSLTKQSNHSKELLYKLLHATHNHNFIKAKEIIKQYELEVANNKDLRHFENNTEIITKNNEKRKRKYSVSQLKTYESCPKKYYYSYICRIPQDPKHFFSFGTAMHTVFELLIPMFEENRNKEEIIEQGLHLLSMNWRSLGYESVEQEREYFEKGTHAVLNFVETELKRRKNNIETDHLEQDFTIELGDKKYELIGFIDRIDKDVNNNYSIIDYKTSKSMAYQSQLQEDLQLYTYALAMKKIKGVYPKSMALWYVIHNRIAEVQFREEIAKKAEQKLIEGIEKIESGNFEPTPSFFGCTYCDFKDICKDSLK